MQAIPTVKRRHARFLFVGSALLALVTPATAQDFSSPYYRHGWGPVIYDQAYFVGMPQYPAEGFGGTIHRRSEFSAGDLFVVGDIATDVVYAPVVQRYVTPVTTYAEVDAIIGYEPIVRYRRGHYRHRRRQCDCNGFY